MLWDNFVNFLIWMQKTFLFVVSNRYCYLTWLKFSLIFFGNRHPTWTTCTYIYEYAENLKGFGASWLWDSNRIQVYFSHNKVLINSLKKTKKTFWFETKKIGFILTCLSLHIAKSTYLCQWNWWKSIHVSLCIFTKILLQAETTENPF